MKSVFSVFIFRLIIVVHVQDLYAINLSALKLYIGQVTGLTTRLLLLP